MVSVMHCFKTNKKITGWCYLQELIVLISIKLNANYPVFVPRCSPFLLQSQGARLFHMNFQKGKKEGIQNRQESPGVSYRHLEGHYLTASEENAGLCFK